MPTAYSIFVPIFCANIFTRLGASSVNAIITTPRSLYLCCNSVRTGMASRDGACHVAQNSTTQIFPLSGGPPLIHSRAAIGGAGSPIDSSPREKTPLQTRTIKTETDLIFLNSRAWSRFDSRLQRAADANSRILPPMRTNHSRSAGAIAGPSQRGWLHAWRIPCAPR